MSWIICDDNSSFTSVKALEENGNRIKWYVVKNNHYNGKEIIDTHTTVKFLIKSVSNIEYKENIYFCLVLIPNDLILSIYPNLNISDARKKMFKSMFKMTWNSDFADNFVYPYKIRDAFESERMLISNRKYQSIRMFIENEYKFVKAENFYENFMAGEFQEVKDIFFDRNMIKYLQYGYIDNGFIVNSEATKEGRLFEF